MRQIQILQKERARSSAPWERPGWRGQAVPGSDGEAFEGGWKISPREMPADCNILPGRGEALGVLLSDPAGAHRVPSLSQDLAGRGVGTSCHIYLFIWLHSILAVARGILSYSMWGFSFWHANSQLWHMGSLDQGWNPGPLHWER